jgi:hypothetical protein
MEWLVNQGRQMVKAACGLLAAVFLIACGSGEPLAQNRAVADADVREITALAEQARSLIDKSIPDSVLRQLDMSYEDFTFRFSDSEAMNGVVVFATVGMKPEAWKVVDESPARYRPSTSGVALENLLVGTESIVALARDHWNEGELSGATLGGEGADLTWHVFWDLPVGNVSATINAITGEFTASNAPPSRPAPTAFPASR